MYAAVSSSPLRIRLMEGFHTEQLKVNTLDDPKRWWEVIDRTTGEIVPTDKWEFDEVSGEVEIQTKPYHEYTVSFLAFLIWDPVHMYNFITNDWQDTPHQLTYDVRQPKTQKYVKEKLKRWCEEDLSKIYDGDALVNGETALATEEGWADSDKTSVAYNFTGSQTNVGSSDNTFTVKWNDTVKESNYNVTIEAGTLTVTAQSIDPENPDYKGITVDAPTDVEYTGANQTWLPTVTDATDPDEPKTPVTPGEKEDPIETPNPSLAVVKTSDKTGVVKLGETITYTITVTNNGNVTINDIEVTDELTGNTGDNAFTIDRLAVGETKQFTATYTVTEDDILEGTIVNRATATGTTPDPDIEKPDVTPGETEDPVEEEKPALAIDKKVVDPKEEYQIGEVVTYEITVTNIGNVTQKNILVEDQMKAAGQARITNIDGANGISNGKQATLDKLVPGAKATITVEYTIVYDDRGNTITNAAVADGEGENPVTPDVPVVIEKVYNINVVHEFAPNNEGDATLLPEDYTIENLKPNTEKSITAEAVKGYVAYPSVQNVTVVDKDITVTFQYYKDVIGTDPTDPEKPDGVPDEFQVVVRFAAVNGTVSTDRAVVTLVDKNGKPAKDGVGHLTKNQIVAATANTGYDQSSLSWTQPTITYDIIGEMTFTATFTATPAPAPAPTEPTTPPARPTRPTTRTTAPTGNATVENAVTPSEEKVEEKAAEIKEVLKSDDDKVPLANQKLDDNDDHKCCILHFLIMLITLLVYAFTTTSTKKRQKKLHEVREELDCELAKRGLPLSTEK